MYYDVSYLQKRLWFFWHMEEEDIAYNSNSSVEIKGKLDVRLVSRVFDAIVDRHEALRTTFCEIDGVPKQKINHRADIGFNTEFINMSFSSSGVDAIIQESFTHKFNLVTGPLIRVKLLQIKDDHFILLCCMHHIISDGWSLQNLGREFSILYNNFCHGIDEPLPAISFHFKDFILKQVKELESEEMQQKRTFWLNQFREEIPVLQLPLDKVRPLVKTHNGEEVSIMIDGDERNRIATFSRSHNVSLFVTLLAALKVLFQRYTNQEDIIVGLPVSGRNDAEMEPVIGCFINTLVLKTVVDAGNNFASLVDAIHFNLLTAYENYDYPFDRLVNELKVKRDTSRSPVFDVTISYMDMMVDDKDFELENAELRSYDSAIVKSKFDLEIYIINKKDSIRLFATYNADLFDRWRMVKMLEDYKRLLKNLLAEPLLPVSGIEFLSPEEQYHLVHEFNRVNKPVIESGFIQLFSDAVERFSGKIALKRDHTTITYKELNTISDNLACYLVEKAGVMPGDLVGLWSAHSEWVIPLIIGIIKAGAVFVPLNSNYPAEKLLTLIKEDDIRVVFTDRIEMQKQGGSDACWLLIPDVVAELRQKVNCRKMPVLNRLNSVLYIIYTSGSTGLPKGVEVNEKSFLNYILWANSYYYKNHGGYDTALFTALSSDLTITTLFAPLLRGDCINIYNDLLDDTLQKIFDKRNGITTVKLTPSHINLLESLPINDTAMQLVIVGGEELTEKQISTLQNLQPEIDIYNEYGPTEATVGCIVERISNGRSARSIGVPIDNTCIYILNEALQLQPTGIAGEIYIGGSCLAKGYRNNDTMTAEKFIPDPYSTDESSRIYKTGDVGRWHPDGYIEYYGRADNQVKIKGYRVEPGEIEAALETHPRIAKAIVMLRQQDNKEFLVACIMGMNELEVLQLNKYLFDKLPEYMLPRHYLSIPDIPLTAAGKIDKNKLLSIPVSAAYADYSEPETEREHAIAEIWEQTLGKERISVEENFFEAGGDSISIIRIYKKITELYGALLTVVDLFKYNSIRAQSEFIDEKSRTKKPVPVRSLEV